MNHPPVKIGNVTGSSWAQIVGTARALARLPHGEVVLTQPNGVGLTCDSKGSLSAAVTVIPQKEDETVSLPESPQGTYFRLEDLEQALTDAGMITTSHWFPKISRHLPRYSRPSGDYFTIEELKKAGEQVNGYRGVAGTSPEAFLDKASAQAAKNRVYDAFGKES